MTIMSNSNSLKQLQEMSSDVINLSFSPPASSSTSCKKPSNNQVSQGNSLLLIGDDNFTFTPSFLESRHFSPSITNVEVTSCLSEDKIPDDFRPNYLTLISQGVTIHFGINPAQIRNSFFHNQYSRILFILPGIAFSGFPDFLDKQHDPLFRLRLHIFAFSFLKSSKNALRHDALVQFLWPRQNSRNEFLNNVPWHSIEIGKIGPFCEVFRSVEDDETLDASAFTDWHPLIHNIPQTQLPPYLHDAVFYSWRLSSMSSSSSSLKDTRENRAQNSRDSGSGRVGKGEEDEEVETNDEKDCNLLFVPPGLWNFSVETLSHVNELFKFEMKTNDEGVIVISRPTLKFDPRFRSDGISAKNNFMKYSGKMRNSRGHEFASSAEYLPRPYLYPPPPPPPDCPVPFYGDSINPNAFLPPSYGYPPHNMMMSLMHEQDPRWMVQQRVAWGPNDRMIFPENSSLVDLNAVNGVPYCSDTGNMGGSNYEEKPLTKDSTAHHMSTSHQEQTFLNKTVVPSHEDVLLYESLEQGPYGYTDSFFYQGGDDYNDYIPRLGPTLSHSTEPSSVAGRSDHGVYPSDMMRDNGYFAHQEHEATALHHSSQEQLPDTWDTLPSSCDPGHLNGKSHGFGVQTTQTSPLHGSRKSLPKQHTNEIVDSCESQKELSNFIGASQKQNSSRHRKANCHPVDYSSDECAAYPPFQTRSLSPQRKVMMDTPVQKTVKPQNGSGDQFATHRSSDTSHPKATCPRSRTVGPQKVLKLDHSSQRLENHSTSHHDSHKYSNLPLRKRHNAVQHHSPKYRLSERRARPLGYPEEHSRRKVMLRHMPSSHRDTFSTPYGESGYSSSYGDPDDPHHSTSYDPHPLPKPFYSQVPSRRPGGSSTTAAPFPHSPSHTYTSSKRDEKFSSHGRKISLVENHGDQEHPLRGSKSTPHHYPPPLGDPTSFPKSSSRYGRSIIRSRHR